MSVLESKIYDKKPLEANIIKVFGLVKGVREKVLNFVYDCLTSFKIYCNNWWILGIFRIFAILPFGRVSGLFN